MAERQLLIVDGHSSHLSAQFVQFCMTHNLDPLVLPPHTLPVLQPLDVGVFKELKKELSTAAEQRWANMPAGTAISKRNVIRDLAEACIKSMKPSAVEKGWEGAGIWPFNRDKMASYLGQQQHLQAAPTSQAILSPVTQARRLRHTNSLELHHREVLVSTLSTHRHHAGFVWTKQPSWH
jgi:hypothetical protein